jgi:sialate O-acetylesterase
LLQRTAFPLICSVLLWVPLGLAQTLSLTSGVLDEQLLQRGAGEVTDLKLAGAALKANNKAVEARVWHKEGPLDGFDWRPVAKIVKNAWTAELRGLPTGGPYRLDLRIAGVPNSMVSVNNILVGDIWVLAGQSNMEGVGNLENVPLRHDTIRTFDMTDRWTNAEEPLHTLVNAADRVHWRKNAEGVPVRLEGVRLQEYLSSRRMGAGLGLPFAIEMLQRTGVPIALVPCAHGGTSMDQWSPAERDKGGDSLYGATIRRIRAVGGKVKGILWYQGESEANPAAAPVFQQKFEALVAAFREDTGQPGLPFYFVQIGRHISNSNVAYWNAVQDAQRKAELTIPKPAGMVAALDLSLDDGIHVGTQDLKRLGARLSRLACKDLFPSVAACQSVQRGPRPESVVQDGGVLRVKFSGVNGGLKAEGRMNGFSIHNAKGEAVPMIYRTVTDAADSSTILLYLGEKVPEGATLMYGAGKDPYCNIHDEADLPVPAFAMAIPPAPPAAAPAKPATPRTQ